LPASVRVSDHSELEFEYRSMDSEPSSICPRLRSEIKIRHKMIPRVEYSVALMSMSVELRIRTKDNRTMYVARSTSTDPYINIPPNSERYASFYFDLEHYGLSQIEKLREGGDLRLEANINFLAEVYQQPPTQNSFSANISFAIPKSDWVEKILPQLKYKDVALLEIPRLKDAEFADVVKYVDAAWKYYSMCEHSQVLSECRKALEALTTKVKDKGFRKEIIEEEKKKIVPDWSRLLDSEEMGDIIGSICQKTFGFVAPGSHAGKSINREDADFALMVTHAMVSLISHKLLPSY